jgi:ribosomal protein L40E
MKLKKQEYEACIENLGLLEEEDIRLQYQCARIEKYFSAMLGRNEEMPHRGLLVFTNDNMFFMQAAKQGVFSAKYTSSQAIRVPLEQITGVSTGGVILKHLKVATPNKEFEFRFLDHKVVPEIQSLLKLVRAERKKMAREALAGTSTPKMVFCKFCGARNKADAFLCQNCGAPLD